MTSESILGVVYSPGSINPEQPIMDITALKDLGIRFIRLQFVDLTNNVRYRVIPIAYFEKMLASPRPSIAIAAAILGVVYLHIADGFTTDTEYLYVPDMSSVRVLQYKPGHASVLGWFEEKTAVVGSDGQLSSQVDLCPRRILHQVAETARDVSEVEFLVGFETEFILLSSTNPITTIHNLEGYSNTLALPTGSLAERVLEEIVDALEKSGIEVQMYHAEAAPGQYEIATGPLPPLQACDALVHTRETIYNVANKHGLRATLAPRIHDYSCGTGAHTHISVHSTNPDSPPKGVTLSNLESSFLTGLLDHLPATLAFTMPLPASYKRMEDGIFSGGTYVCWATNSREVPVRLCNAASPGARNFEIKQIDGTSNPYLALAAVLGAGALGICRGGELTMKDCQGPSAAERGEEGRRALGITERLPLSWEEARKRMRESAAMKEVFGQGVIEKYLSVNKVLAEALDEPKDEAAKATLLVEMF
ncbi:Glutamine synthetase/guanido kinase [Mycena venus]|uniref:Glutamine synthetase n=1 Tax=Mycena venus TaxID=2733690 RepID=A0A8H6Y8P8_9AGAR|nr:Glutamine synthetase/guanido kinase [Mycena venus]